MTNEEQEQAQDKSKEHEQEHKYDLDEDKVKLTVKYQWEHFHKNVLTEEMTDRNFMVSKNLFYAGIEAMLRINWAIGKGKFSSVEGSVIMNGCYDEMFEFSKTLKKKNQKYDENPPTETSS